MKKSELQELIDRDLELYYVTESNTIGINKDEVAKRLPKVWEYIKKVEEE